jgi:hypothetical protein
MHTGARSGLVQAIQTAFEVHAWPRPCSEAYALPYELPVMPGEVFSRYFPAYLLRSLQDPDFGHDNWAWLLFSMADYQLDKTLAYRKFEGFSNEQFEVVQQYLGYIAELPDIEFLEAKSVIQDAGRVLRYLAAHPALTSVTACATCPAHPGP